MTVPKWLMVVAVAGMATMWSTPVLAASHSKPAHKGGSSSSIIGNDISWPQCGGSFPSGQAFGIVGVNDGKPNTLNPCLGTSSTNSVSQSELNWAFTAASGVKTSEKPAQLYVNTADPGPVYNGTVISDWPSSSLSDPYGSCSSSDPIVGLDSTACAWQYGYNKAQQDAGWLATAAKSVSASPAAGAYPWWLDVETGNTWQSGNYGQAMNLADLQGMVAFLQTGASVSQVGIYSTTSQWSTITGVSTPSQKALSTLYGLNEWLPGARNQRQAASNCNANSSFTGGAITTTQWTGSYDYDYPCQG